MLTAVKYRIYPNKEQSNLIDKTIGCARLVYNLILNDFYEHNIIKTPAKYKQEYPFLKEVDALALCNSQMNLKQAFRNHKQNPKHFSKPKFKKKSCSKLSYKTNNNLRYKNNNQRDSIRIENNKLILPKFKEGIKIVLHRNINGIIKSVTVEHTPSGYYTATILYNISDEPKSNKLSKDNILGIDLGIKYLAITSDNKKYDNPKYYHKTQFKLIQEQRILNRRLEQNVKKRVYDKDGKCIKVIYKKPLSECKNYQKQKKKVAKIHNKIKHQRLDNLHKISNEIIKNHDYIVLETLRIKNLMKNRRLSKSIADVGWSLFINMLEYKAERYGKQVIKIDQWFPSSQICSHCQYNSGKKPLHIRKWKCSNCHIKHDRDINAAINIKNKGLDIIS